jgi:hypothetical protein
MPPLAVAAGIAAVGTIGGAVIGANAQNHAVDQATAAQQQATAQQLELGRESFALNQGIYNSNYSLLSPFVSRGNVAGDQINALLGLPAAPAMTSPMQATQAPAQTGSNPLAPNPYTGPSMAQIAAMQHDGIPGNYAQATANLNAWRSAHPGVDPFAPAAPAPAPAAAPAATPAGPIAPRNRPGAPSQTTGSAQSALNNFANSAGMQFQLQQGTNALNNLYAARGMIQSGAAMKGISNYAQDTALNRYFMPYMGLLSGQQNVGAQAGSAVAGVGSGFGNTAANINAGMGNAIGNGADALSNAALLRGQNSANMWGSVGNALGGLASSFSGGFGGSMPAPNLGYNMYNLPSPQAASYLPGGFY